MDTANKSHEALRNPGGRVVLPPAEIDKLRSLTLAAPHAPLVHRLLDALVTAELDRNDAQRRADEYQRLYRRDSLTLSAMRESLEACKRVALARAEAVRVIAENIRASTTKENLPYAGPELRGYATQLLAWANETVAVSIGTVFRANATRLTP